MSAVGEGGGGDNVYKEGSLNRYNMSLPGLH